MSDRVEIPDRAPRRAIDTVPYGASLAAHIAAMIADGRLRCAGIAPDGSARVVLAHERERKRPVRPGEEGERPAWPPCA